MGTESEQEYEPREYRVSLDWGGSGLVMAAWKVEADPKTDAPIAIYAAVSDEPGGKEEFLQRVIAYDRERIDG